MPKNGQKTVFGPPRSKNWDYRHDLASVFGSNVTLMLINPCKFEEKENNCPKKRNHIWAKIGRNAFFCGQVPTDVLEGFGNTSELKFHEACR